MPDFNELLMEAHRVLDTARRLNADANTNGLQFLNTELEISRRFAEKALAAFSAGDVDKAKKSALAAKTAYRAVHKFLPRLAVIPSQERELVTLELGKLTPLIDKLSTIP